MFLGWGGGEGDKPLLACDLTGKIQWKNIRGGIASAGPVASDGKTVYAFNSVGQYAKQAIYRVDAKTGRVHRVDFAQDHRPDDARHLGRWQGRSRAAGGPGGCAAAKFSSASTHKNAVIVVDAATGGVLKKLDCAESRAPLRRIGASRICTSLSGPKNICLDRHRKLAKPRRIVTPALAGKDWVSASGRSTKPATSMPAFAATIITCCLRARGKPLRTIGRKEGRALMGPWTPDGMFNVARAGRRWQGKLWVAEDDTYPKRISVWNTADRRVQAGIFRLIVLRRDRRGHQSARPQSAWSAKVANGRSIRRQAARPAWAPSRAMAWALRDLVSAPTASCIWRSRPAFCSGQGPIRIYRAPGRCAIQAAHDDSAVEKEAAAGKKIQTVSKSGPTPTTMANEQPDEVKNYPIDLEGWFAGWYMPMTPDLTFYGSMYQVKSPDGPLAAPAIRHLPKPSGCPAPTMPSTAAAWARSAVTARPTTNSCCGTPATAKITPRWIATISPAAKRSGAIPATSPACMARIARCGPMAGMIRGAYDICGSAKLPDPIGNVWFVPTNKGEWHVLTEKGYYLTQLFESDPIKVAFPDQAVPGVSLDTCPPGAGEEAFGGSITQGVDGKIHVQAGHISFWNWPK